MKIPKNAQVLTMESLILGSRFVCKIPSIWVGPESQGGNSKSKVKKIGPRAIQSARFVGDPPRSALERTVDLNAKPAWRIPQNMKMKALVKFSKGPGNVEIREVEEPHCGADQVKLEVAWCGICGTDLHVLQDTFRNFPPVVLGHEIAAKVVETGKNVQRLPMGA